MFPQLIDQCIEKFTPHARRAHIELANFQAQLYMRLDAIHDALDGDPDEDHIVIPFKYPADPKIVTVPRTERWFLESVTLVTGVASNVALWDDPNKISIAAGTITDVAPRWAKPTGVGIPETFSGLDVVFAPGVDIYISVAAAANTSGNLQFRKVRAVPKRRYATTPGQEVINGNRSGFAPAEPFRHTVPGM